MTGTLTYTGTLAVTECCTCHMAFAMPRDFQRWCRESPSLWFYCPLGHKQHYEVSETDKLRADLARAQRQRDDAETAARAAADQAQAAERSAAAYKGHLTRVRKRVASGVCPCCNRHFADLGRHMQGRHPGYAEEEP